MRGTNMMCKCVSVPIISLGAYFEHEIPLKPLRVLHGNLELQQSPQMLYTLVVHLCIAK